jgi:hypothetical protein
VFGLASNWLAYRLSQLRFAILIHRLDVGLAFHTQTPWRPEVLRSEGESWERQY